jgi:hypothetical protein
MKAKRVDGGNNHKHRINFLFFDELKLYKTKPTIQTR